MNGRFLGAPGQSQEPSFEVIESGDAYEAIVRGEVDIQISTAKRFPRPDVSKFQDTIREMACLSKAIAASCSYTLERSGKPIVGPSVRFAEIIFTAWRNLRTAQRVLGQGATHLTCQAMVHDLETNVAASVEVLRRITKSDGTRYNDDMLTVAGNAGCSIAYRNAVLKVVPKAFWGPIWDEARMVARGDQETLEACRTRLVAELGKEFGVAPATICARLGVRRPDDIDLDGIDVLIALQAQIREGSITVEKAFAPIEPEDAPAEKKTYIEAPNELNQIHQVKPRKTKATAPSTPESNKALKAETDKRMRSEVVEPPAEEGEWGSEPTQPAPPAKPTVAMSPKTLWKDWLEVKAKLTEPQLADVRAAAGVEFINPSLPAETLALLLATGREYLK